MGKYRKTIHFMPVAAALWVYVAVCALLYIGVFHEPISNGDWLSADGFARLLIPDTYIYAAYFQQDLDWLQLLLAGVKNAIGPSLIWFALGDDSWYGVAWLNSAFVLALIVFILLICQRLGYSRRQTVIAVTAFGMMPVLPYYCVGALKEIPTALFISAFFYFFISDRIFFALCSAALLVIFRYQLIVVVLSFWLIYKYSRRPLYSAVLLAFSAASLYPVFSSFNLVSQEATVIFREDAEVSVGLGAGVEFIRDSVPVLSALAVCFRVIQSIMEPFVTFFSTDGFFESGDFSVLAFCYSVSLLMALPFFALTFAACLTSLRRRGKHAIDFSREMQGLLSLVVLYLVMVGGFSFVHHRYIFPVIALVVVGGAGMLRRRW